MSDCRDCGKGYGLNMEKASKEESLIIIKPDGVKKKVIGRVISRFEEAGLNIDRMKMMNIDRDLAGMHYQEHREKDFFGMLIEYITSGPVVVMQVSGPGAINKAREIMGPTDSTKAPGGTIRGDFGSDITVNVVHGSDSVQSARREIDLFFGRRSN